MQGGARGGLHADPPSSTPIPRPAPPPPPPPRTPSPPPTHTAHAPATGGFLAPYLTHISISAGFALVAGGLVSFVEPLAAGSGIPEVKTYLNGVHIKGLLTIRWVGAVKGAGTGDGGSGVCACAPHPLTAPPPHRTPTHNPPAPPPPPNLIVGRTLVTKLSGITFSIAAGLIAGKEGPFVHGGGIVGGGIGGMGSQTITQVGAARARAFKACVCGSVGVRGGRGGRGGRQPRLPARALPPHPPTRARPPPHPPTPLPPLLLPHPPCAADGVAAPLQGPPCGGRVL